MKNIYYILLISICMPFVVSCIDDKGNYDYKSEEEIVPFAITQILHGEDIITNTLNLSSRRMTLKVDIEGLDPNTTYSYKWFVETSVIPTKDKVISLEKDVDQDINLPAGYNYILHFEVKDNSTGIYVRRKISKFSINPSVIGAGWYMMKEVDGKTDLDFISDNGKNKLNDILTEHVRPSNSRMNGKPVNMYYYPRGFYEEIVDENGHFVDVANLATPVLVLASETDLKTYNSQNLELMYDFEKSFFQAPTTTRLQSVQQTGSNVIAMNDGVVHSLTTLVRSLSKYGPSTPSRFNLSSECIQTNLQNIYFDLNTSSFKILLDGPMLGLTDYAKPETGAPINIELNNMDADLLKMVTRYKSVQMYSNSGFAFMKNRKTNQNFVMQMDISEKDIEYPVKVMENIVANAEVLQAEVLGAAKAGSFVYYAKGNQLKAYLLGDVAEKEILIREFENEDITYIGSADRYNKALAVVIATQSRSDGNWKVYICIQRGVTAPQLIEEPASIFEGESPGKVKVVYYYYY